jgi:hypothetical protein
MTSAATEVASVPTTSSPLYKEQQQKKTIATTTSFKLELKHCEVGCFLQDKVVACVANLARAHAPLRVLELPGLGSDELLHVIALYCTNLEVLNVQGSREAVTDAGFAKFVKTASPKAKTRLAQLNVSRCMLTQVALVHLQALTGKYIKI